MKSALDDFCWVWFSGVLTGRKIPPWRWDGRRIVKGMVSWTEMPGSPSDAFCDRLQSTLLEADFDGFAEAAGKPYCAAAILNYIFYVQREVTL